MKQIGRRIYFDKTSGEVIQETGERMGDVVETTTDQDFQTFGRLKPRVPDTVGMIQLAYGQDADKFMQYPFYHVDPVTQKVVWDTIPQNDLEAAKAAKIAQLDFLCNREILAGFTSSALGPAHQYDFDDEAQRNLTGRLALINANPNYPNQFNWKTKDQGPLPHTKTQFIQLCMDADDFKDSRITRFWDIKNQVKAITTTPADVNKFSW